MDKPAAAPLMVSLFFVLRCLIPMLLMLGVTYLLKKFGLIVEAPPPPPEYLNNNHS
jgi:hypothetical protein